MGQTLPKEINAYRKLGLTPVPLKSKGKEPLVRWRNGWNPTSGDLKRWAKKPDINWAVRCDRNLAVLDFDSEDAYYRFIEEHHIASTCPVVRTGRGFHIWVRPKEPVRSCHLDGFEVKGDGSYVVAPPSIHPSGTLYTFLVAPNGILPEFDLRPVLKGSPKAKNRPSAVSDFALRYGKSSYPESLCGKATKILTRSDGKMKHLVSLRCWKWHCDKCAPLLRSYWVERLSGFSFRFILQQPNMAKPTTFLRRVGKPPYVHIVANGESWLFLLKGEAESIWNEACKAGYELVAGDIAGDPTPEEIRKYLREALCQEDAPLSTTRKITHSRSFLKGGKGNESKQQTACAGGVEDMKAASGGGALTWDGEIVIKPIKEVAKELETKGWRIVWLSEVEALAIQGETPETQDTDIVDLIENLGVKLKREGKEYKGLCPFHDDHRASLSVNREKGLWHCFGCGRGGTGRDFVKTYRRLDLFE